MISKRDKYILIAAVNLFELAMQQWGKDKAIRMFRQIANDYESDQKSSKKRQAK